MTTTSGQRLSEQRLSEQWLPELMAELEHLDAARPDEMQGCSAEELDQIRAECPFEPVPADYLAFMARLGRSASNLFRGSDLHFPACLGTREYAQECRETEDPQVPVGQNFFFGHHQGYVLYYFQPGDERVWTYILEEGPKSASTAGFRSFVAEHLDVAEDTWPRVREMDRKNQELKAARKQDRGTDQ